MLATVGTRLHHTRTAVEHAARARETLAEPWRSALVPAVWLHDIGYHPSLTGSGFHPLDGARFLRAGGWAAEICDLVAWHTAAEAEATLRNLIPQLGRFGKPPRPAIDAISWADLRSSPTGETVTVSDRLDEILTRYPPGSVVHRAVQAARVDLLEAADRVEAKLRSVEVGKRGAAVEGVGHP